MRKLVSFMLVALLVLGSVVFATNPDNVKASQGREVSGISWTYSYWRDTEANCTVVEVSGSYNKNSGVQAIDKYGNPVYVSPTIKLISEDGSDEFEATASPIKVIPPESSDYNTLIKGFYFFEPDPCGRWFLMIACPIRGRFYRGSLIEGARITPLTESEIRSGNYKVGNPDYSIIFNCQDDQEYPPKPPSLKGFSYNTDDNARYFDLYDAVSDFGSIWSKSSNSYQELTSAKVYFKWGYTESLENGVVGSKTVYDKNYYSSRVTLASGYNKAYVSSFVENGAGKFSTGPVELQLIGNGGGGGGGSSDPWLKLYTRCADAWWSWCGELRDNDPLEMPGELQASWKSSNWSLNDDMMHGLSAVSSSGKIRSNYYESFKNKDNCGRHDSSTFDYDITITAERCNNLARELGVNVGDVKFYVIIRNKTRNSELKAPYCFKVKVSGGGNGNGNTTGSFISIKRPFGEYPDQFGIEIRNGDFLQMGNGEYAKYKLEWKFQNDAKSTDDVDLFLCYPRSDGSVLRMSFFGDKKIKNIENAKYGNDNNDNPDYAPQRFYSGHLEFFRSQCSDFVNGRFFVAAKNLRTGELLEDDQKFGLQE